MAVQEYSLPGGVAPYWRVTIVSAEPIDEVSKRVRMLAKLCGVSDTRLFFQIEGGYDITVRDGLETANALDAMLHPNAPDVEPSRPRPPEWGIF